MAKKAAGQADSKKSKGAAKSNAKTAKGSGQPFSGSGAASPTPAPLEQMQQCYGNSAVLKYLQAGSNANMSKVGGKPQTQEQAEAFAAVARPPTPEELLNLERDSKKNDDREAWNRIRKDKGIVAAVKEASELTGIDTVTLEKMIIMESSGHKKNLKEGSSYHGLMQMGKGAFQDARDMPSVKKLFASLKVKDAESGEARAVTWEDVKTDPRLNVLVGAIYAKWHLNRIRDHNELVNKKRGERVQPTPLCKADAPATYADIAVDPNADGFLLEESAENLYFAHQQGFNGMVGIYEKPDNSINGNQSGNMRPYDIAHFTKEGPGERVTNAEYLEAWKERMSRIDQFMKEGTKDNG